MGAERGLAGLAGSYTPTTPANWADPPPTTIADALDRLNEFDVSIGTLLTNRVQGGTSSGAGGTSTFTLDPITPTPGSNANFSVNFFGVIASSNAGDQVSAQLERDGAPIGPTIPGTTDANNNLPISLGPFVDHAGAGAHVYRLLLTNVTGGGHTVQLSAGSGLAQEVL